MLPATTAVAESLGLWCMGPKLLGSNPDRHVTFFFFFLSQKFYKFFGGLVVPYVKVPLEQNFRYQCRYCRHSQKIMPWPD